MVEENEWERERAAQIAKNRSKLRSIFGDLAGPAGDDDALGAAGGPVTLFPVSPPPRRRDRRDRRPRAPRPRKSRAGERRRPRRPAATPVTAPFPSLLNVFDNFAEADPFDEPPAEEAANEASALPSIVTLEDPVETAPAAEEVAARAPKRASEDGDAQRGRVTRARIANMRT